jgi:hypothetical protein
VRQPAGNGFGCTGKNVSPALVGLMINANRLGMVQFTAEYGRK